MMDYFDPAEIFSTSAQSVIADVSDYSPTTIDDMIKMQEASDKSHKLHKVLTSWSIQQSQERKLRRTYALCFIGFLGLQLVTLNIAFFLVGAHVISITEPQFNVLFVSTFGEIISLVLIVTKYLFPAKTDIKASDLLKDL